ncbi:MAG: FAD:protein FMN transferase [Bacteroidales bacterium]|nr:FAD:protein FMN transferase [Bacteroidales bacterium]
MHTHSYSIRNTVAILFLAISISTSCKQDNPDKQSPLPYQKISGFTQGTTFNITYASNRDLKDEIDSLLQEFDGSLSTYQANSIISRINLNDPDVIPDQKFLRVYEEARKVYEATGGAFDITLGPIVNAWGFGPGEKQEVDPALINELLQHVGMDKTSIKDGKFVKEDPEVLLNVNAIAQGYSVDVVCAYLDTLGITDYLVEIGGELRCRGVNPKGSDWRIGVDRPVDGNQVAGAELQVILELKGKSLATSGNYRKYFEKDGVKYAHSIDPKTGYPVLGRLLSATILAEECITADAYATSCMVLGLENSIRLLNEHPELEAYLIYSDEKGNFRVFATQGMSAHIVNQ